MAFTYEYPRPAVCVDCVVFGLPDITTCGPGGSPAILLVERGQPPFLGMWALPGGFIDIDEPLEKAAARELFEETGIHVARLEFAGVYGAPGRDPRGRTISIVYRAVVWKSACHPQGGDDAKRAEWFPISQLPTMAFDHSQIVEEVTQHWRQEIQTRPFGRELLPDSFGMKHLHRLYEVVLGRSISLKKLQNFLLRWGVIEPVPPPELGRKKKSHTSKAEPKFRFCSERYEQLRMRGFIPEVFMV